MTSKTRAIVAYITLIGWLIAYFSTGQKNDLVKYHLKQALGINILAIIYGVAVSIIVVLLPFLGLILSLVSFVFLALAIFGIINANNDAAKPVPVVGKIFEDKFAFIK